MKREASNSEKTEEKVFTPAFIAQLIVACAVTYLVFGVILNIAVVSGESMLPTLEDGSIIIAQRIFYTPERGDIILCTPSGYGKRIVKRVIGVPGDVIDIDFNAGDVYVNGELLEEDYITEKTYTSLGTNFPVTVEEGHVFVLGDNRNDSLDSRSPIIGQVSTDEIMSGMLFILKK